MSKSQTNESVERTLEFILGAESKDFFFFANDLRDFYNFSNKTDNFFKTKYFNYHEVLGEICFKRPSYLRKKLVNSLLNELTYIHSFTCVFKIVLCLEYLGVDTASTLDENVNTLKIICVTRLIEATSDDDGYVPPIRFHKLYEALSCIDK